MSTPSNSATPTTLPLTGSCPTPGACHCGENSGTIHDGADRIALAGAPNAGKTSIYNSLTGLRAKTGNYPGVTVARAVGTCQLTAAETDGDARPVTIEDLPGAYSLDAISPDEQVVQDVLAGRYDGVEPPDALVVVVDATTLSRSLTFVAQALALGLPTCLAVTMTDELTRRGGRLDVEALGEAIGIPAVRVIGNRSTGIPELRKALGTWRQWARVPLTPPVNGPERLSWSESVLKAADYAPATPDRTTAAIDRVLLHPVAGTLVFLTVMFVFFQSIFTWAAPFQDAIESAFGWLGGAVHSWLDDPAPTLAGLLADGVIGGVGAVLVFLPQIAIMFLLIALLEGVGYMSRAAFLMDRIMGRFGLEGRAFVALLSSFACAIPGVMATRTLPSAKDRIATMMAAPLMTCSARLPVYILLISLLVSPDDKIGPFGLAGTIMFGLYLAGAVAAMLAAWAVKHLTDRGGVLLPFYMEMPPYRLPRPHAVALMVWDACKGFLLKAGTIILATTVVIWVLLNVPARSEADFEAFCAGDAQCAAISTAVANPDASQVLDAEGQPVDDAEALTELLDAQRTSYTMDHSVAAALGRAVEPVFAPLGFDWRVNVAVLSSLGARETAVATLGQIAAASDPEDPAAELSRMTYQHDTLVAKAGEPLFGPATIGALLAFFVFAMQCMATAGVIRRETGTWKWSAIAYGYMFVLAWVAGTVTHAVVAALS
ncbi:ferrous iron transporter B [Actinomyces trachealis]|uniref:ferrous iron transporter B n=1 Tax=Actinomyces trachealis TaxID=2763540 RepID=UPI001892B4AE|nr:ferrous iron transporter B [Actinomyces trachealis]